MTGDWRERLRPTFEQSFPGMLDGGEGADVAIAVRGLRLKSGSELHFESSAVTAIVGANNAGKSTLLRELSEMLQSPGNVPVETLAVESLDIDRRGSVSDFVAWLADRANVVVSPYEAGFQRMQGGTVTQFHIQEAWGAEHASLGPHVWPFVGFYANADARLHVGGSVDMRESTLDAPLHPIHYLQDDRILFSKMSDITHRIFGRSLTLDTLGRKLRLRVGEMSRPAPTLDNISLEYRTEMAALPALDIQGDGMRSLLGQLLPLVTGSYPIVLIDEPEAFLHPPQAHALGRELGSLAAESKTQVILATHDRNLLAGLLSSGVPTSVVRLARAEEGQTEAFQLDSQALRSLWTDPVLRYTNVLDGLFHRLVVLAEAEGDCGFLNAALDCSQRTNILPVNEVLFIPTGGKDGMAKVARALQAVRVPVVAAPDLDRLSDKEMLRGLVDAVGSQWSDEMSRLWDRATVGLRGRKEPASVGHVLDAINAALGEARGEPYSSEYKEAVKAQLRSSESVWEEVKRYGVAAFRGEARPLVDELLDALDAARVVLVREGELERLAPSVAVRKGPGWLQAALSQMAQCSPLAQTHLDRILTAGVRPF